MQLKLSSLTLLFLWLQISSSFAFPVAVSRASPVKTLVARTNCQRCVPALKMTTGLEEDPQLEENRPPEERTNIIKKLNRSLLHPPDDEFKVRMDISNVMLAVALAAVLAKASLNLSGYSYEWVKPNDSFVPRIHLFSLEDARMNRQLLLEDRRYQYERHMVKKQLEQNLQEAKTSLEDTSSVTK